MSRALIEAAKRGDKTEVERLLNTPGIDINYRLNNADGYEESPILAAIAANQVEIAIFLTERGAALDIPNCPKYTYYSTVKNNALPKYPNDSPYASIFMTHRRILNERLFKAMIQNVTVINPIVDKAWGHNIPCFVFVFGKGCDSGLQMLLAPIAQHEAFIRGDIDALSIILDAEIPFNITAESFKAYTKDRKLISTNLTTMRKTLTHLSMKKIITADQVADLQRTIESLEVHYELSIDSFPEPLRASLGLRSEQSLEQMCCELQSLLYLEDNLPSVPLDSPALTVLPASNYNEDLTYVANMQHPAALRSLLACNTTSILMRLANSGNEIDESRAAFLLAAIILRHSNTKIKIQNTETPLLDTQQQRHGIAVLHAFYRLTHGEKIVLKTNQQQQIKFDELTEQNVELQKRNAALTTKVDQLTDRMASMEILLAAAMDKLNQATPTEPKKTDSRSIFLPK